MWLLVAASWKKNKRLRNNKYITLKTQKEHYNRNKYISNFERIYKKLLRWRKQSYLKQRLQKSVWKECNDCSLCTDFAKGPSRLGVQRGGSFTGLGGSKRSLYLWRTYEKFQRDVSLLCGALLTLI